MSYIIRNGVRILQSPLIKSTVFTGLLLITMAVLSSASVQSQGRESWTGDRRQLQVGDIITVLVDEYTLTSLSKRIDGSEARKRDLNAGISLPSGNRSIATGGSNNSSHHDRGSDSRTNRIATELSVRIVEIADNGAVRLEGTKAMEIDRSVIRLGVSGWARQDDITRNNTIPSLRLADSDISYQSEGPMASAKKGFFSRIVSKIWP